MLHIRRVLSKKEKQEYQEWLKKNKAKKISKNQQGRFNQERYQRSLNDPRIRDPQPNVSQTSFLSRLESLHPETAKADQKYEDPEMALREAIAQEEIAHKRTKIAPHYSKGPYQYISDDIDLKTLGKKV